MFSIDTYRPPRDKRRQLRKSECYFCGEILGMGSIYVHASDEMLVVMTIHESCLDSMITYMSDIEEKAGLDETAQDESTGPERENVADTPEEGLRAR